MHLLLTDRLTCPRCGPTFGLILLANRLDERLVVDGRLGCPNCRDAFPIEDGFTDLRAPPRGDPGKGLAGATAPTEEDMQRGERVVALLGIARGPGTVALVGEPARFARSLTTVAGEIHVVGVDPDLRSWPERPRVSRIMAGPGLPFFDSSLRGVAVDGRLGPGCIGEAARVVAPRGRVVVVHTPAGADQALREKGLAILASEAETVVAARD